MAANNGNTPILIPETLLDHWQGHRRLTRRMIEAFPEDKLFSFSVGSMRPFSELAMEFLKMAEPITRGVATGEWVSKDRSPARLSPALPLGNIIGRHFLFMNAVQFGNSVLGESFPWRSELIAHAMGCSH
jgi:hypothetical protein